MENPYFLSIFCHFPVSSTRFLFQEHMPARVISRNSKHHYSIFLKNGSFSREMTLKYCLPPVLYLPTANRKLDLSGAAHTGGPFYIQESCSDRPATLLPLGREMPQKCQCFHLHAHLPVMSACASGPPSSQSVVA